jgi:hypothetical protein
MARITTIKDMLDISRELCALGPRAVLLKGGHVALNHRMHIADVEHAVDGVAMDDPVARVHSITIECEGLVPHDANMEILFQAAAQDPTVRDAPMVVDVLCEVIGGGGGGEAAKYTLFVRPYLDSTSTHGTGCTLSAALACALARGESRTQFFEPYCSQIPAEILFLVLIFHIARYSYRSRQVCNYVHPPWHRHCIPSGQRTWPSEPHAFTPPARAAQASIVPL